MPDFADTSDVLNLSSSLRKASVNRVRFNPEDEQHIDSLKTFLRTGNWGEISFFCESPYTDVPMTVLMSFAQYELDVQRETPSERVGRLALMNLTVIDPIQEAAERAAQQVETNRKLLAR